MKYWKPLEGEKVTITVLPPKDGFDSFTYYVTSKEKLFNCRRGECDICLILRHHESNYPFSFGV